MNRWLNKVAVVTGASSGIGSACAKYLVNNGMVVVGLARRKERVEDLRSELDNKGDRLHAIKCDVGNEDEVVKAFAEIEKNYGPVAVLVNNAGVGRMSQLLDEKNSKDIHDIINTNVMGVAYCTREAFRSMKTQTDGHVFIINSITGHKVLTTPEMALSIYPPSKYAVTAMTEVYRQEFLSHESKVKITSISPGFVKTEIAPPEVYSAMKDTPILQSEDIADALIYCLQTPPHVQIHELTIKPVGERM